MPNHFHLLIKQLQENGVSEFMRKFIHSYTKYWNVKNNNQGPLLQGMFKAVLVETEEQLIHLSRYIHLNPIASLLVEDLKSYRWSSYFSYIGLENNPVIAKDDIFQFFKTPQAYEKFILDRADYSRTLELLKHTTIDIDF